MAQALEGEPAIYKNPVQYAMEFCSRIMTNIIPSVETSNNVEKNTAHLLLLTLIDALHIVVKDNQQDLNSLNSLLDQAAKEFA